MEKTHHIEQDLFRLTLENNRLTEKVERLQQSVEDAARLLERGYAALALEELQRGME